MKNFFKLPKRAGFSLVELLISLIIISLVIAAFCPIMTKKLKNSTGNIAGIVDDDSKNNNNEIILTAESLGADEYYYKCDNEFSYDQINNSKFLNCTLRNLPPKINMIMLAAGGGGGNAQDGNIKNINQELSIVDDVKDGTFQITPYMKNVKITIVGGGGGGGGAIVKTKTLFTNCPAKSIELEGRCFTTRNVTDGNVGVDSIPSALNGYIPPYAYPTLCKVPDYSCSGASADGYPACNRGICGKVGAAVLCQNLILGETSGWRLPNGAEATKNTGIIAKNINKLSLCDSESGSSVCKNIGWTCGSGSYYCTPSGIQTSYLNWSAYLTKGVFSGAITGNINELVSVRCVLDKYNYTTWAGAGGASGVVITKEIPEAILDSCTKKGCTLQYSIGKGGLGGLGVQGDLDASALNGLNGSTTSARIYSNEDNSILASYNAQGGAGATGAGVVGGELQTTITGVLGQLGGSTNIESKCGNGGNGGSVVLADGSEIEIIEKKLDGESGENGCMIISYKKVFKGAPGGGGGGGAYIKAKSLSVPSSKEIKVQVGLGDVTLQGTYDGKDGGDSKMFFATTQYIAGGGKGGARGLAQTETNPTRQAGQGGSGGTLYPAVLITSTKGESSTGVQGEKGIIDENRIYTIGGRGGANGVFNSFKNLNYEQSSACGGFFENKENCYDSYLGQESAHGAWFSFIKPAKLNKNITNITDFGSAGQGGGGGGWKTDSVSSYVGVGGRGNDGYVYVWW